MLWFWGVQRACFLPFVSSWLFSVAKHSDFFLTALHIPTLLFQSRDPRGSPCCSPSASSWGPPAAACSSWPWLLRKPRQSFILPFSFPHLHTSSGCLWWRLFFFFMYSIWVGEIRSLYSYWVSFGNISSTENSDSRETTPKAGYQGCRDPVGGWETASQKQGRFNAILCLIAKE